MKMQNIIALSLGVQTTSAFGGPVKSVEVVITPEVTNPYEQNAIGTQGEPAIFDAVPEGQTLFITDVSLQTTHQSDIGATVVLFDCRLEIVDASDTVIFTRYIPFNPQVEVPNFFKDDRALADATVSAFASSGDTPRLKCFWYPGTDVTVRASISGTSPRASRLR